ncbi:hypothetical protein CHH91_11625 [Virgibacillus sp. 7505]|uniref:hypothetical protein n=1 Tax=Virgibacillus sp. 7505 TaxID=2022548 RepID=UPI000BA5C0A0|nr:hypothetical protein [Virgibacillus sp. 7505]PAE15843.1 hypothetical protein CHH91_11625 [Virgibacillus sp. 7505]
MKKSAYILFLLLLTFLAACSSNDDTVSSSEKETAKASASEASDEEGGVEVDKNLLSVEVSLPASFFEGQSAEDVIADAKDKGIEVTANDDGSYTYKMSKSEHKKLMDEMSAELEKSTAEMVSSGDYPSIKDISYNKDFSEFTMVVDKEAYENSMDGFASFGLGMSGMMYQLFNGADPDEYSITISIEDEASGEVIGEVVYPDAMEDVE